MSVKINDSIERLKKECYNAENKKNSNIHTDSCQSKFHGSGVVQRVARLTHNRSLVDFNHIKGSRCQARNFTLIA